MKQALLKGLVVLLAAVVASGMLVVLIVAQNNGPRPRPLPPTAVAHSCGQRIMRSFELQFAVDQFFADGCNHIDLDYIADGFYLVRGTKILIGE